MRWPSDRMVVTIITHEAIGGERDCFLRCLFNSSSASMSLVWIRQRMCESWRTASWFSRSVSRTLMSWFMARILLPSCSEGSMSEVVASGVIAMGSSDRPSSMAGCGSACVMDEGGGG